MRLLAVSIAVRRRLLPGASSDTKLQPMSRGRTPGDTPYPPRQSTEAHLAGVPPDWQALTFKP